MAIGAFLESANSNSHVDCKLNSSLVTEESAAESPHTMRLIGHNYEKEFYEKDVEVLNVLIFLMALKAASNSTNFHECIYNFLEEK